MLSNALKALLTILSAWLVEKAIGESAVVSPMDLALFHAFILLLVVWYIMNALHEFLKWVYYSTIGKDSKKGGSNGDSNFRK